MTFVIKVKMKRIISLVLVLVMLLGTVVLSGCVTPGNGNTATTDGQDATTNTDTTDNGDETTSDTTADTTPSTPADAKLTIAGVDIKEFVIVRTHVTETYARKIASYIKTVSDFSPPIVTEAGDHEHIIDLSVSYNGSTETLVLVEDGNLVVTTASSAGLDALLDLFKKAIPAKATALDLKEGFTEAGAYTIKDYTEYNASDLTLNVRTENAAVGYYKPGDAVAFIVSLKDKSGNYVSCPKITYEAVMDGSKTTATGSANAGSGEALAYITVPTAGFIKATFRANNGQKPITGISSFIAGAAVGAETLKSAAETPADFEEFWKGEIDKLLKIDPVATKYEATTNSKIGSGYKGYIVEVPINENGDFVTGIVTIPNNASAKSLKIVVEYMYYSAATNVNAILSCQSGTIKFSVLAHGVHLGDAQPSGSYYNEGSGDKNTSYFKNMYLRDVQAIRFLMDKFGPEGENLWNGKDITVTGGSQGGAQSVAVAGLAEFAGIKITQANVNVVWMCDIAGYKDPTNRMKSDFIPNYTDALLYFDVTNFAKYITANVNITVGLVDTTAMPSGITCLYNAITSKKSITYVQGANHTTYWDSKWERFTINGNIGG